MIEVVKKPIGEVARLILSYVDPDSGMRIFGLTGFNSQPGPLTYRLSLDDPTTLEGNKYAVFHKYHSKDCAIEDPADPGYLNAIAKIADINKNSEVPDETQIIWNLDNDNMQYPQYEFAYGTLEKLLQ